MFMIGEIGEEDKQALDSLKAPGMMETREVLRLGLRLLSPLEKEMRIGIANDLAQTILWVLCYRIR